MLITVENLAPGWHALELKALQQGGLLVDGIQGGSADLAPSLGWAEEEDPPCGCKNGSAWLLLLGGFWGRFRSRSSRNRDFSS